MLGPGCSGEGGAYSKFEENNHTLDKTCLPCSGNSVHMPIKILHIGIS